VPTFAFNRIGGGAQGVGGRGRGEGGRGRGGRGRRGRGRRGRGRKKGKGEGEEEGSINGDSITIEIVKNVSRICHVHF
jgi:hypothetical protein